MYIKRGFPILTQIDKLGLVGFISSLGLACVGTIWAIYLESFLHNASSVGFLISFFTITSLVTFIFLIPIMEKNSKIKLYSISLFLFIISYLLFSILSNIYAVVILGFIISIVVSLRINSYGIIVIDKSKKQKLAKNEGLIYTFMNLSWLIGPLIAGFLSSKYGVKSVFLISALFIFISLFLFHIFRIRNNQTPKRKDHILKATIDFFKNKNRVGCYFLSGAINFWWALIYVYIPILIIESGFDAKIVGYFLFGIVIPLILFTYSFGKLAGKIGFKKIFFIGYSILGIAAIISFFLSNLFLILGVLILASVGAAMVESTSEAYFFDIISKNQRDKYYGIYNTSIEVNHGIASFLGAVILFFFSFKYLFLLYAVAMFVIALVSLKIKNIIESKRL